MQSSAEEAFNVGALSDNSNLIHFECRFHLLFACLSPRPTDQMLIVTPAPQTKGNQSTFIKAAIKTPTMRVAIKYLAIVLIAISARWPTSLALRTGAPGLSCETLRPIHALFQAKPASASQFFFWQSSYMYEPEQRITANISTESTDRFFRGFIIQAYDPISGTTIGQFLSSDHSHPVSMCPTTATHRNNDKKTHISLTWTPPASSTGGQVRMRGSVVVSFNDFFTGFESTDQIFEKFGS